MSCDIKTVEAELSQILNKVATNMLKAGKTKEEVNFVVAALMQKWEANTLTEDTKSIHTESVQRISKLDQELNVLLDKWIEGFKANPKELNKATLRTNLSPYLTQIEIQRFRSLMMEIATLKRRFLKQISPLKIFMELRDKAIAENDIDKINLINELLDGRRTTKDDPLFIAKREIQLAQLKQEIYQLDLLAERMKRNGEDTSKIKQTINKLLRIAMATEADIKSSSINATLGNLPSNSTVLTRQVNELVSANNWISMHIEIMRKKLDFASRENPDRLFNPDDQEIKDAAFFGFALEDKGIKKEQVLARYREYLKEHAFRGNFQNANIQLDLAHYLLQKERERGGFLIRNQLNLDEPYALDKPVFMHALGIPSDNKKGSVPYASQRKSLMETAMDLSLMLGALEALKNANGFNGHISELMLASVLGPDYLDVDLQKEFEASLVKMEDRGYKHRLLTSPQGSVNLRNWIYKSLKRSPIDSPLIEESEAWKNSDEKLVGFDLETFSRKEPGKSLIDTTDGIALASLTIKDGKNITHSIYSRGSNGFINSRELQGIQRFEIEDINQVLQELQKYQDMGYKVLTYNGARFDFEVMKNLGANQDLLTAVTGRSIDLYSFLRVKYGRGKGLQLKELGASHVKYRNTQDFLPEGFLFVDGVLMKGEERISFDEKWVYLPSPETNEKLVAYASNDTSLLLDMYTTFKESEQVMIGDSRIDFSKPVPQVMDFPKFLQDSLSDIPEAELMPSFFYHKDSPIDKQVVYTTGFNVEKIQKHLEILQLAAIHANTGNLDPDFLKKINTIEEHRLKTMEESVRTIYENEIVLRKIWQERFKEKGFPIEFRNKNPLFTNMDTDVAYLLPRNDPAAENKFETEVISGMQYFINSSEGVHIPILLHKLVESGLRSRSEIEELSKYLFDFKSGVIIDWLKQNVNGFTRLSNFGDGSLGYMVGREVGIGIMQTIYGIKEGMQMTLLTPDQITNENEEAISRVSSLMKLYAYPKETQVHKGAPFTHQEQERNYQEWRLRQRHEFILRMAVMSKKEQEKVRVFIKSLVSPSTEHMVSPTVVGAFPRVSPIVEDFSAFGRILDMDQHIERVKELILGVPQLLMFMIHDGFYYPQGIKSGIFLKDQQAFLPAEYDGLLAAGPFAATTLPGIVDNLAHFLTFGQNLSPEKKDLLRKSLKAGFKIRKEEGEKALDPDNRVDMTFMGRNTILAAYLWSNEGKLQTQIDNINTFWDIDIRSNPENSSLLIDGQEHGDPRIKAAELILNYMQKSTQLDIKEGWRSLFDKLKKMDRSQSKELFKGALTPRTYNAGFNGMYKSLTDHNTALPNELQLSIKEIAELTDILMTRPLGGIEIEDGQKLTSNIVDAALGITPEIKAAVIGFHQNMKLVDASLWSSDIRKRTAAELKRLHNIIDKLTRAYANELDNKDPKFKEKVQAYREKTEQRYQDMFNEIAKIRQNPKDIVPNYDPENIQHQNQLGIAINEVIVKTFGSSIARSLKVLAYRQLTPFKIDPEVWNTQKDLFVSSDIRGIINGRVWYHPVAEDAASGRQYAYSFYAINPTTREEAKVRTLESPRGMWQIDPTTLSDEDITSAAYQQLLMDLAPNYLPPDYDGTTKESREVYFRDVDNKSKEVARFYSQNPDSIPQDRLRFRSYVPNSYTAGSLQTGLNIDPNISGIPGLNSPAYHIDINQRGIPVLHSITLQNAIKESKIRKTVKTITERSNETKARGDFSVFSSENRGHHPKFLPTDLYGIPSTTPGAITDTSQTLISYFLNRDSLSLIDLMTRIDRFKRESYWNEEDPVKVFLGMQMLSQTNSTLQLLKDERDPVVAAGRRIEVLSHFIGRDARKLAKERVAIDLATGPKDLRVNQKTIDEWDTRFSKDEKRWLNVFLLFGDNLSRLAPFREHSFLSRELVVFKGSGKKPDEGTSFLPIRNFQLERLHLAWRVVGTQAFRSILTKFLMDNLSSGDFAKVEKDNSGTVVDIDKWTQSLELPAQIRLKEKLVDSMNEIALEIMAETEARRMNLASDLGTQTTPEVSSKMQEIMIDTGITAFPFVNTNTFTETLYYPTEATLTQMLNLITNKRFVDNIALAMKVGKPLYTHDTPLDRLVDLSLEDILGKGVEEEYHRSTLLKALTLLHGVRSPNTLSITRNKSLVDMMSYLGTETINLSLPKIDTDEKGRAIIKEDPYVIQMRDLGFFIPIVRMLGLARSLGLYTDMNIITNALLIDTPKNNHSMFLQYLKPEHEVVIAPRTKMAMTMLRLGVKAGNILIAAQFAQPGINEEGASVLFKQSEPLIEALLRIQGSKTGESNKFYRTIQAIYQREGLAQVAMQNRLLDLYRTVSKKHFNVIKTMIEASVITFYTHLQKGSIIDPKKIPLSTPVDNAPVFYKSEEFKEEFGEEGLRISQYYDSLVEEGSLSRAQADISLILLGNFARNNPEILTNLYFSTSGEGDPAAGVERMAYAAKKNGKYILGLNIPLIQTTPENEYAFRFAEEILHLARIRFIKQNGREWDRVRSLWLQGRTEPMMREVLTRLGIFTNVTDIDQAVQYAMSNVDEFFAHFGAVMLLQKVYGKEEVIQRLSAKYKPVSALESMWKKALTAISDFGDALLRTVLELREDPTHRDIFIQTETLLDELVGIGIAGRVDAENGDIFLGTRKHVASSMNGDTRKFTPADTRALAAKEARRAQLEWQSNDGQVLTPDETTELKTLGDYLSNDIFNPKYTLGMRLGKASYITYNTLPKIQKKGKEEIDIEKINKDEEQRIAIMTVMLAHNPRSDRSDSKGTPAALARKILPESVLDWINKRITTANDVESTYNSRLHMVTFLSELIDGLHVVTEDTHELNKDNRGFEQKKDSLRLAYRPITLLFNDLFYHLRTSSVRNIKEETKRVHQEISARIDNQPITKANDPAVESIIQKAVTAYNSLSEIVRNEIQEQGIKDKENDDDRIGIRRLSKLMKEEDNTDALQAISLIMTKKALANLEKEGLNARWDSSVAYLAGLLPDPDIEESIPSVERIKEYILRRSTPGFIISTARDAIMEELILRAAYSINKQITDKEALINLLNISDDATIKEAYKKALLDVKRLGMHAFNEENSFLSTFGRISAEQVLLIIDQYKGAIRGVNTTQEQIQRRKSPVLGRGTFGSLDVTVLTHHSVMDLLAARFFSLTNRTYIFKQDSHFLTYKDLFHSTYVPDDVRATIEKYFTRNIQLLAKSLIDGAGQDALSRKVVQERHGIDNLHISIEQLLGWVENAKNKFQDPTSSALGQKEVHDDIQRSVDRLRNALAFSRGSLNRDMGASGSIIKMSNHLAKFSRYFLSRNISLATMTVEGLSSVLTNFFYTGYFPVNMMADIIIGYANGTLNDVGRMVSMDTDQTMDGNRLFPNNPKRIIAVVREMAWIMEAAASNRIDGNTTLSEDEENVEGRSFIERLLYHNDQGTSNASNSIYAALTLTYRKLITERLADGSLVKLRDHLVSLHVDKNTPRNMDTIKEALRATGADMHPEVIYSFVSAGLFKPGVLEKLNTIMKDFGAPNGFISNDSFDSAISTLLRSKDSTSRNAANVLRTVQEAYNDASFEATRLTVARSSPLDGSARSESAHFMVSWWKQYPGMMIQQLFLRKAAISSIHEYALVTTMGLLLDAAYSMLLMFSIGAWDEKRIKRILQGQDKTALLYMALRYPLFSGNAITYLLGLMLKPMAEGGSKKNMDPTQFIASSYTSNLQEMLARMTGAFWGILNGGNMSDKQAKDSILFLSRAMPGIGSTMAGAAIAPMWDGLNPVKGIPAVNLHNNDRGNLRTILERNGFINPYPQYDSVLQEQRNTDIMERKFPGYVKSQIEDNEIRRQEIEKAQEETKKKGSASQQPTQPTQNLVPSLGQPMGSEPVTPGSLERAAGSPRTAPRGLVTPEMP